MMVDYDVEGVPIKNYDQQLRKKQVSGQNFQKVHLLYIAVSMMEDYDVKSVPIKNHDQQLRKNRCLDKIFKRSASSTQIFPISYHSIAQHSIVIMKNILTMIYINYVEYVEQRIYRICIYSTIYISFPVKYVPYNILFFYAAMILDR